MQEPTHEVAPDGTYVFEVQREDGTRVVVVVVVVFPEDIDEVAGPAGPAPLTPEERRRRYRVARLLAEPELRRELEEG
jgi:hypothetical protein